MKTVSRLKILLIIITLFAFTAFGARRDKKIDTKLVELQQKVERLKKTYTDQQAKLQHVTEERWSIRQKQRCTRANWNAEQQPDRQKSRPDQQKGDGVGQHGGDNRADSSFGFVLTHEGNY